MDAGKKILFLTREFYAVTGKETSIPSFEEQSSRSVNCSIGKERWEQTKE